MSNKVELLLGKNYKIKIKSDHQTYLKKMIDEFSIHVPNYFHMGKFKAGMWNGKINFITEGGMMPYGLLTYFLRMHKKMFPELSIVADDGVKSLFKGPKLDIKYDLKYEPRFYQQEAIETCLNRTKGIIQSATASGKSLVISYIIKNLFTNRANTNVRNCLLVVPSVGLVEQFKADMLDYGLPENLIGRVYTKVKEWDRHIIISTWQSLKNNHNRLSQFDCVIIDETHKAKANELKKILSKCRCNYRFGFTGTLNVHITDLYNVQSYIGPVLKEYSSGFLAEQGFISKCNVNIINIQHNDIAAVDYKGIKDECFNRQKRLTFIGNIVKDIDDSILLLVSYINEGDTLKKLINRRTNKEVIFLSGKDSVEYREEIRQRIINGEKIALIATYGIFEAGVNIPNLKYLIMASPTKSKIRTLQSIGRVLRLHESKTDGAHIFDIVDQGVKFLPKHAKERREYYETEGFGIEEIEYTPFITLKDVLL